MAMITQRVHLTFPDTLIQEPLIYNLGKQFNIVTNIRRANVEDTVGWVILEISGEKEVITAGTDYLKSLGVEVNLIDGDLVEG